MTAGVPVLVDQFGKPLVRAAAGPALAQPVATASLTGVRQAWTAQTVASGLTPQRLARIMRQAAEGDHVEFVILAEEMEERDWHYAAALGQRKLAVLGLDRTVTAAPNDPQGEAIAAAVREDLVDEAVLYYAPAELGPDAIPFALGGPSPFALEQRMLTVTKRTVGDDVCVEGLLHDPWAD